MVRTKRVSNIIYDGPLYVWSGNTFIRASHGVEDDKVYLITYHDGLMPAFDAESFPTLESLCERMKSIEDLRKWRSLYDSKGEITV